MKSKWYERDYTSALLLVLLLCMMCGSPAHAQTRVNQGLAGMSISPWWVSFPSAQHIICDSGCGSPPSVPDNAAFTFGTTSVTTVAYVVDDVATNTVTENNYGAPRMTTNRIPYADLSQTGAYPAATGVATSANQTTELSSLATIVTNTGNSATSANQTNGNQKSIVRGGAKGATTAADVTSTANGADRQGLDVQVQGGSITANAGTNLNTSLLLLDATFTGRMPAGASPADNESNTNTALSRIGNFNFLFDGTAWDRWPGDSTNGGKTNLSAIAGTTVLTGNGATGAGSERVTVASDNSDIPIKISQTTPGTTNGVRPDTSGATVSAVPARADYIGGSDGTNLRGLATTSGASNTATTTTDTLRTSPPCTWFITHRPAAATKATISKAAGAAGVRHVAVTASFCLSAGATLQAPLNVDLIDGATGGATRLASWAVSVPVNTTFCLSVPYLNSTGTAATAMTIEFSAAGAAASLETVNLCGYSTP